MFSPTIWVPPSVSAYRIRWSPTARPRKADPSSGPPDPRHIHWQGSARTGAHVESNIGAVSSVAVAVAVLARRVVDCLGRTHPTSARVERASRLGQGRSFHRLFRSRQHGELGDRA